MQSVQYSTFIDVESLVGENGGDVRMRRFWGNSPSGQHPHTELQPQRSRISTHHRQMSASSIHADAPPAVVRDPEGLQYETGPQLGKGGFAICHRAKLLGHEHLGSSTVALKIVKSKMEPPKLAQKVWHPGKDRVACILTACSL